MSESEIQPVNPYAAPAEPSQGERAVPVLAQPITLSGVMSLDHYLRAHRLAWRHIGGLGWKNTALLFGVVIALAVILTVNRMHDQNADWGLGLSATIGIVVAVGFALFLTYGLKPLNEWHIRRAFRRGMAVPECVTWTFSDEGLESVSESSSSQDKWIVYASIRTSDDLILLYNRDGTTFIPIPREFSHHEGEWHCLTEFLRAKFPEKQ